MHLLKINPTTIFYYFNNVADAEKADKLHSITIVKAIRVLSSNIIKHHQNCLLFFSCRICILLVESLIWDMKIYYWMFEINITI